MAGWEVVLNSLVLILLSVLVSFAIWKMDKVLTLIERHNQTLYGVDGETGLVERVDSLRRSRDAIKDDVLKQAGRISSLEQDRVTKYVPRSFPAKGE